MDLLDPQGTQPHRELLALQETPLLPYLLDTPVVVSLIQLTEPDSLALTLMQIPQAILLAPTHTPQEVLLIPQDITHIRTDIFLLILITL
jgi:hypothetical protein